MVSFRPHHVGVSVRDLDASLAFYEAFGFREVNRADFGGATIVHLRLDQFVLELFWYPKNRTDPPLQMGFANDLDVVGLKHFALAVEDVDAALSDLRSRGLADESVQIGSLPNGSASWIFLKDPDGVWVEVIQEERFDAYTTPWPVR